MQTERDMESKTVATRIMLIIQSIPIHESSRKESNNYIAQFALTVLIPLVIVLVWTGFIYEKLAANPLLAILLVLGVLVILFGGTIRFGPIQIQKTATTISRLAELE